MWLVTLLLPVLMMTASVAGFSASSAAPYCLNGKLDVDPTRRDEFLETIKFDGRQTLATEPDALQFVIGEDTETPNRFYLHEQYMSKDAFDFHTKTEHFAKWSKFVNSNPWKEGTKPLFEFYEGTHAPRKIASRSAFCLNVKLCIKLEVRDEFLRVIDNNQKGSTGTEPLCFQYDYGECESETNSFLFHEQYEGKQGFDEHAAAPHFLAWEEFAGTDPFKAPPVVSFFRSIAIE